MTMARNGVLYIVPGGKYLEEASVSARSLSGENPEIETALVAPPTLDYDATLFDEHVQPSDEIDRIEKVFNLDRSPFDRTLYLDSDTYVCGDIADLFELLDTHDVAAAHAPFRRSNPVEDVPDAFPELNGGVFLYGDTSGADAVLDEWRERYRKRMEGELPTRPTGESDRVHDQGSLREAVYHSEAKLATLPPEYNFRISYPGYLQGEVKILHGRDDDLAELARALNSVTIQRVYTAGPGRKLYTADGRSIDLPPDDLTRLRRSLGRRGVAGTGSLLVRRLLRSI